MVTVIHTVFRTKIHAVDTCSKVNYDKVIYDKIALAEWNENRPQKSSAISEYNRFITQVQGDICVYIYP